MQCLVCVGLGEGDGLGSGDDDGSELGDEPAGVLVTAVGLVPLGAGLAVRAGALSGWR
jgi:hypothetical protein